MSSYLGRVRHLATHFEKLKGLRTAWAGVCILICAALQPVLDARGGLERKLPIVVPVTLGFVGLLLVVNAYYRRRFGSVVPRRSASGGAGAAVAAAAALAWLLAALVADSRLEGSLGWRRPLLTGLTLGAWGLLAWARVPERRHYLWLAAGAVAAILPAWPPKSQLTYVNLALGVGLLVGGILDHLALLRLTRRVEEAGRAEAV
jgi:hypothetical protein